MFRVLIAALAVLSAPMASAVAADCVFLGEKAGRGVITNVCSQCVMTKVERRRPGEGFPTNREYTLPPKSQMTLPFRGQGQTRVLSEGPCAGAAGAVSEDIHCVLFVERKGRTLLFNNCASCRTATVESDLEGGSKSRSDVTVAPQAYAVPAAGAVRARILADQPCR